MKHLLTLMSLLLLSSPVTGQETLNLKLHVHIMRDIEMRVKGESMANDHISKENIANEVLPEVNRIWSQANINWELAGLYDEDAVKKGYRQIPAGYPKNYKKLKNIVEKARRDSSGKSDPRRQIPLFLFMQQGNRIKPSEFGQNNFHVYLYPFIGNTSQGNAMRKHKDTGNSLGFHTVVGTWSNKHNKGKIPERFKIVEDWEKWTKIKRGSLSRTIAHEIGHVIGLRHNRCEGNCLMGPKHGYKLTNKQIRRARNFAKKRIGNNCKPLKICGYSGKMKFFK